MVRDQNESGELDAILMAPLREIADNGFSQRVLVRVGARQRRWLWLQIGTGLLTIGVCAAILPIGGIAEAIAQLTPETVFFVPLMAAIVVTALSLLGEQLWSE